MRTLSAKKLSLDKARGLGLYTENVTIGDCELTLRNLRPDEYEAALADCEGHEEMSYLNVFQKTHVSRAIIGVNGTDLSDVGYIEDEEEQTDPKTKQVRVVTVKYERHTWVHKKIVDTWGKEALYVAYRKFGDVVSEAEKKAREGIEFKVAEETAEEKYRRLLGDMREIEDEVPPDMVERILDEAGLVRKTSVDQAKAIEERLKAAEAASESREQEPEQQPEPQVAGPAPVPARDPASLMRQRVPMNQAEPAQQPAQQPSPAIYMAPPVAQPVVQQQQEPAYTPQYVQQPVVQYVQQQPVAQAEPVQVYHPSMAGEDQPRRVQPQGSVPQAVSFVPNGPPPAGRAAKIAAEMADEEAALGGMSAAMLAGSSQARTPMQPGPAVPLMQQRVDEQAVKATIDQPPVAGINPRFKPHGR
jgi:hypothetical protein